MIAKAWSLKKSIEKKVAKFIKFCHQLRNMLESLVSTSIWSNEVMTSNLNQTIRFDNLRNKIKIH